MQTPVETKKCNSLSRILKPCTAKEYYERENDAILEYLGHPANMEMKAQILYNAARFIKGLPLISLKDDEPAIVKSGNTAKHKSKQKPNLTDRVRNKVLETLKHRPGKRILHRDLLRNCHLNADDFKAIMESLEAEGLIFVNKVRNPLGGAIGTEYILK